MVESNAPIPRTAAEQMDVRSLVEIVIRRRWIILGVALPVVFVALIGTLSSTQTFMARSTLMIEMASPTTPAFSRSIPNYDMVLSAAAELAMSAPVSQQAGRALADSLPFLQRRTPEFFADVNSADRLGEILLSGVNCSHVGESNLLSLSFSHPDPSFAIMGARALADAFVAFNISTKRNSPAVGYYDEQIAATQAEIDSLMSRRVAVLDSTGLLGMQADLRQSFQQIRGLEAEYFKTRSRREGLEAELNGLYQAIEEDVDFMPQVGMSESGSIYRLQGELDTRMAKIAELQQTYTEDSSFIRREREQLQTIREVLYRERGRYLRALEVQLAQAASEEQSLRDAYQRQLSEAQSYPRIQGEIEALDQRLSGLNKLMENLQFKRGEVRMSASSDVRISDVLVIGEPVLDVPVGRGRKMLYLIISIVLAVAMGLVAAFFVESNDHRIYDRRRAELYLDVPVLGSLPDTSHKIG